MVSSASEKLVSQGESAAGDGDFTAEGCCPCCGDQMTYIEDAGDSPDVYRCHRCNKEMEV